MFPDPLHRQFAAKYPSKSLYLTRTENRVNNGNTICIALRIIAMGYTIHPMSLRDLPQVVSIERDSFPFPWSADYFRHEITRNKISRYLVACEGNVVLGYIGVWLVVGEIHITTIAVDKDHRRKGIGESLLISVIELAFQHRARFLTLEVREANVPAWALYAKYGFSEMGKRPRYYRDTDENAVIMTTQDIYSDSFQRRFQRLKQEYAARSRDNHCLDDSEQNLNEN